MTTKTAAEESYIEALQPDEKHARESEVTAEQVDKTLGLQMISIRLPKALLDDLKFIAGINGLGYQPLIRRYLVRAVDAEMKALARQYKEEADRHQCDAPPLKRKTA